MTTHKITYPLPKKEAQVEATLVDSGMDDYRPSASMEVTETIATDLSIGDEVELVQRGTIEEIGTYGGAEYNVRIRLDSAELRSENDFEKMSRDDD